MTNKTSSTDHGSAPTPNWREIAKALENLFDKDDVIELRALHKGCRRIDAGYFDGAHRDKLIGDAKRLNSANAAIYVNLNPINPILLDRYTNRIQKYASSTAKDAHVIRRCKLLVDIDPTRPTNTSATEAQLLAAEDCARRCFKALKREGWPNPLVAASGNGYHLIYPLDLPNNDESRELIKGALVGLAQRFDNASVTVDQSVSNAGRIIKLYGTVANKGDHTPATPWRRSRLIRKPERGRVVTADQLRAVQPSGALPMNTAAASSREPFDLKGFLKRLDIGYTCDLHDGRNRYKLDHCPFNSEHGRGEAAIFRGSDGLLGFKCQHNSCGDKSWQDVRALVDGPPDTRTKATSANESQATKLLKQVEEILLFHNDDGAYAVIPVNGHTEIWPLGSSQFRNYLTRQYYLAQQRAPGVKTVEEVLRTLSAKAQFECPEWPVHRRVAEHAGDICIDMCDAQWSVIQVRSDGWHKVAQSPVNFIRARGMQAIPEPQPGGSIEVLWDYINVSSEDARSLVIACLVAALRPTGPYPVLVLQGEQGTGKSTCAKLLRTLVDPSAVPLRSAPRNEQDLVLAARNSWIIAFTNLSGLKQWLSDGLCRISTGGGFGTKKLYTDTEEVLIDVQRPMILEGIDNIATRQDLIDRSVIIDLDRIASNKRRPEAELLAAFDAARPAILGKLFDRVSQALKHLSTTQLRRMPRMADFALWATAAEPAEEQGRFEKAYSHNRKTAVEVGLESSPVAMVLMVMLKDVTQWQGTASQLLAELSSRANEHTIKQLSWPRSAQALSAALRRLAPALRTKRVKIETEREAGTGRRIIKIENTRQKRLNKKSKQEEVPA